MSISLNANFELLSSGLYLDARQQFNTIIEMKDFAETSIPDGFITYNKETQKHYVFSSSNTIDATLGKWREYNSGDSSSTTYATWDSNVDYKVGNVVLKDEVRYSCIADHTSTDFETDSINWVVVLEQYYHVTQEQYNKMVSDGLITDATKDLYIIDGNSEGGNSFSASYTSLSELGLTADATVQDVVDALPIGGIALLRTDGFTDWSTLFNNIQWGYLKVEKTINGISNIELQEVVAPNRSYFGTQSSGIFSTWQQTDLTDINTKLTQLERNNKISVATLVVNSKTFKIDISKISQGLNGNIKFGYFIDKSYGEIIISSLGTSGVMWDCSTGIRYVKSVTYTIDPDRNTHITIGVEFYNVVYGVHHIETPSNFATINSFTADAFTGTSVATRGSTRGRNNGVGIIYDVADLGLTEPCTTVQIAQAMRTLTSGSSSIPQSSMIGIFNNGVGKITDAPTQYGLLQVNLTNLDGAMIRYDGVGASSYAGSWIGQLKTPSVGAAYSSITWRKIIDENSTDLTDINTKLTQLENKANFIPVATDNPTDYDLNNYKENGNYSIGRASNYKNTPELLAGLLTVFRANTYRLQIYTVMTNNNVYYRYSTDWGSTWSSWALLNDSTDLTDINTRLTQLENKTNTIPVTTDNPSDKDFNNYRTNGYYSIGTNDYANKPDVNSGTLLVFSASSYKTQLYITNYGNMYFRNFGSSWSEWVNVNSSTDGGGTGGVGDVVIDNASISMGRKSGTTIGDYSTASGYNVEASAYTSHAEGRNTTASGTASHAEGGSTIASGQHSHAEGFNTEATKEASHAEGMGSTASGLASHAEGYRTTASGEGSHAEGFCTTASGDYSHAGGGDTIANAFQYAIGHYNVNTTGGTTDDTSGSAFVIGNGINSNGVVLRKNAFRVAFTGATYGAGAYNTSGADYAEYFEWIDGNVDNEDRRGLFVTLDGDKIKLANDGDYILGVVSSNPVVLGNSDMEWQGRFLKDKFGSLRIEKQIIKDVDEQGNEIEKEVEWYITNPEYDPNLEYVERKDRQEWTPVGFMGQLVVIDDGTCVVNGYCKCGVNGVATKADNGYRVMKRIDENTILVLIK